MLVEINGDEVDMTWKHRTGPNLFEDGGDSYTFSSGTTNMQEMQTGSELLYNYPNPFRSGTMIRYQLSAYSDVELRIYDLTGRKVSTLVNDTRIEGLHEAEWNTEGMQPGIYICELKTGYGRQVMKMIIIQ